MSKRDRGAAARRSRVLQALVMQAGLAAILVVMAALDWGNWLNVGLYLAALVVPVAWAYGIWSALQREEAARREGRWTAEVAAAERKRGTGILGGAMMLAVVLAFVVYFLTR